MCRFTSRNVPFAEYFREPSHRYTLEWLRENGHCMTDIFVNDSRIPMAGKGVFAKRSFKKGEIVSISPVTILPKHSVEAMKEKSLLINYCMWSNGSDACLFPFGMAGLMNHGGIYANVEIDWYSSDAVENMLEWPISKLERLPFAPLDWQYRATKNINEGEELIISYGDNWERAWVQHLEELKSWSETYDVDSIVMKPQFRQPFEAPEGFFPANFQSECIGKKGCGNNRMKRRAKKQSSHSTDINESRDFARRTFTTLKGLKTKDTEL